MLRFIPWRRFFVYRDRALTTRWLGRVASTAETNFRRRIRGGPKTGVKYPRLPRRSSKAGEYPANQSGNLLGSVASSSNTQRAEVGSDMFYSLFLAKGTSKMGQRKMSREALKETLPQVRGGLKGFTRFKHGNG